MSLLCGSSWTARLNAAIAPGMSSAVSRCRPSMNCEYASPVFADGSAVACADTGCAAAGAALAARRHRPATTAAATFIEGNCSTNPERCHIVRRMAVDPDLLAILACPNCKTPVTLVKNGSALKCATCKRVYPIKDDIPVMLVDEATVEP